MRGFAENELGPRVLQVRRAALLAGGCTAASIADGSCDPARIPAAAFEPRSLGGGTLLEGSVEWRMMFTQQLGAVGFVDAARVGTSGVRSAGRSTGAVTPGVGLRARSPLGLLRLDFGLRSGRDERLPVVVADETGPDGGRVLRLTSERRWNVLESADGGWARFRRRIVVHFSMGEAF